MSTTADLRYFLASLCLGVALFGIANSAAGQTYPSRPVRFIVPFPAGGPTDVVSRAITVKLAEALGQPVVVENVGGAGGSIGMTAVAKAAPDGYVIGLATSGTHAVNPHLYAARLGYDAIRDFTPITPVVSYVNMLVVHPAVPARNVQELVAYAKANPQKVSFASSGNGATNHLSGELLKTLTGAPMVHVPYKGGAQALNDLLGGNTTFMFDLLSSSLQHVRSGKLRALAVTSGQRTAQAPDVPTMDESGVPGYADAGSDLWFGIVGPANMPPGVVTRLNTELRAILQTADTQERLRALYLDAKASTPAEFARTIAADHEKWGRVVRASGAKLD